MLTPIDFLALQFRVYSEVASDGFFQQYVASSYRIAQSCCYLALVHDSCTPRSATACNTKHVQQCPDDASVAAETFGTATG